MATPALKKTRKIPAQFPPYEMRAQDALQNQKEKTQ
jgi:hypothetical protein